MSRDPQSRALESLLPEDVEAPDLAVTPVEAPPPEVLPGDAARDAKRRLRLPVGVPPSQLPAVLFRPAGVADGHLDHQRHPGLAGLQPHPFAVLLGLASFAGQVPVFFFSPFGGMIADRFERRRLMMVTQSLACLQSAALAVLTLDALDQAWEIVGLALFQGLINAFDVPARQGMTVEMVGGKDDLRHAISLNSMMFNLARIVGPSLAGILIALVGAGWCFTLDACSYGAVIASLFRMRFRAAPAAQACPAACGQWRRALPMSGARGKFASRCC